MRKAKITSVNKEILQSMNEQWVFPTGFIGFQKSCSLVWSSLTKHMYTTLTFHPSMWILNLLWSACHKLKFNVTMGILPWSPTLDTWLKVFSQMNGGNNYFKSREMIFCFTMTIKICSSFTDRALNTARKKLNDNRRACHSLFFPWIHW